MTLESDKYYDEIGNSYRQISKVRNQYLNAVDKHTKQHIQNTNAKNILDIGSGDGERILRIITGLEVNLWVLENSTFMCDQLYKKIRIDRILQIDISNPSSQLPKVDVISALWNVFGHIPNLELTLKKIHSSLNYSGTLIFDVNNPINIKQYGLVPVLRNWIKLAFLNPQLEFQLGEQNILTKVYFRKDTEYRKLLKRAGFSNIRVRYIDYSTGEETSRLRGQMYFECTK